MQAYEISRTGMDVEWQRMEVIAQNLANAGTTRTGIGEPYQPVRLVSGPQFATLYKGGEQAQAPAAISGVRVYGIEKMNVSPRMVYEPSNPQADAKGFVAYPGIDHAGEMTLLVKTARVYEANLVAMNAARSMYLKALELGSHG
jgi:flagellar basal-body rod protein FlgC